MPKTKATFEIESELWKEFHLHARVNGATASRLLRNAIRRILGKPESEMEKEERNKNV